MSLNSSSVTYHLYEPGEVLPSLTFTFLIYKTEWNHTHLTGYVKGKITNID